MANSEKVVEFLSAVLSGLIPKPADVVLKPLIKPVGDNLKAWFADKETKKALLKAAEGAESDFREQAKENFGNDDLTQAVASFPLYNGDLFQAALQSLPAHFNETFIADHISDDLSKYWSGKFSVEEITEATALYVDCLRVRLLQVNGFADIVARLAILRTDRRTEDILEIVKEILALLSEQLNKNVSQTIFRSVFQLPQPPADFTGREDLIDQILKDFDSHKGATISGLTGMGGIGKSALGLIIAHKIADRFPDGQIFLDLKGTTTPLSAMDIARHVILSFEPTMDVRGLDETNFQAYYQQILKDKKVILFFDNARSADQIAPLRPPETCALLVTSRWTFPVSGLKNHKVGVMDETEAQNFLLELCPRIDANAADLAKACAYLPLALRIAGSFLQINVNWKVDKYIDELNSVKGKLATLTKNRSDMELTTEPDVLATFELSYNQLKDTEKKNWRSLGVFTTSFDESAAKYIWEMEDDDANSLLGILTRYSLIDFDEITSRYELHDLLTEYALRQMPEGEAVEIRVKHASHFLDVLDKTSDLYQEGDESIFLALRLFDLEWVHIQSAYAWLAEHVKVSEEITALLMKYPAASSSCLSLRLIPQQRAEWLESALQASKKLEDKKYEGIYLNSLGVALLSQGDYETALSYLKQSLAIQQQIGDKAGEGTTLNNISQIYDAQGDYETALSYLKQSLEIRQQIGDKAGEGTTLNNISALYHAQGDYETALSYLKQSLAIQQQIGDKAGLCATLFNMGHIHAQNNQIQEAVQAWVTVYILAKQMNLAQALKALSDLAPQLGLPEGLEGWENLAQRMQSANEETQE